MTDLTAEVLALAERQGNVIAALGQIITIAVRLLSRGFRDFPGYGFMNTAARLERIAAELRGEVA